VPANSNLLEKFATRLFDSELEKNEFIRALSSEQDYPDAILWLKDRPSDNPFTLETPLPWQPDFVDRLTVGQKPGTHSLHQRGHFYCLDMSSIFTASVLTAIPNKIRTVLDLCAAPGGKSLFALRCLSPDRLICNEVISHRRKQLRANLLRCGVEEPEITGADPAPLSTSLEDSIDLVIVDAPCSGQSLLAKGIEAKGCFHPLLINKNAQRQRRILANAVKTIKAGGYLAYMTCTFATKENEETLSWLVRKFPEFKTVPVPALSNFASTYTDEQCYRIWPHHNVGAGGFTSLLQRQN